MARKTEIELLDPLTGIFSRASLKFRLQEEVDRSHRYGQPFSIFLLDLDHFKSVNDAFGHRRGDDILLELARRLRANVRKSDLVFRYGGDEFIILMPGTDKDTAIRLSKKFFEMLRSQAYGENPPLKLTFSMGIASFPEDADSPEGLFDVADKRHYQAKRQGRNRIVSADLQPDQVHGFDSGLRVIDREQTLERVYRFFEQLTDKKQGVLEVTGVDGVGKSRFLEEVAKIARLHGHMVFPVTATPALQFRALGALLEAERGWESLPSFGSGEGEILRGLQQLLDDKGNLGLVITVDDLQYLDRQSLQILERIFFSPALPQVAIAFSGREKASDHAFADAPLLQEVVLHPFSREGVHIWLRHALQWEPPDELIDWMILATGGLPSQLQSSLNLLIDEGLLVQVDGWSLTRTKDEYDLARFPPEFWQVQQVARSTGNIPRDLTTFIGRTEELHRLKKLLAAHPLVTVVGPGGLGKSRLALQAALEFADRFRDGAYYVETSPKDDEAGGNFLPPLVRSIAKAVSAPLKSKNSATEQLLDFLKDKHLLLVLSIFENAFESAPFLEQIRKRAPNVAFLFTAREPLNLAGEVIFELGGLTVPEEISLTSAAHSDAVQLFLAHARRANPEFALNESNVQPVVEICRLVGGLPLGIVLAASWLNMFSAQELSEQIRKNYSFLSGGRAAGEQESRSLQAVFDYFWGLLSLDEQNVFAKLSIFRGEFSGIAAMQVANASPFFLGALANRIFLIRAPDGMFRLHDLLRQYAAEKLDRRPAAAEEAHQAHANFYLLHAQSLTMHLRGRRQAEARDALSASIENIRSAWFWALRHKYFELAQAAVEALYLYYEIQGRYREGETLFGYANSLLEAYPASGKPLEARFEPLYARVRLRAAIFNSFLGFIVESREVFEACLEEALRANDLEEAALSYEHLGWTLYELALPKVETRAAWEKSLELFRRLSHPWGISRLLYNLAHIAAAEEKAALLNEKLEISEEIGDVIGIADSLMTLAGVDDQRGNIVEAYQNLTRSLELYESISNLDGIAFSHFGLGNVHMYQGQYEIAHTFFEKALQVFRQAGNVNGMSTSLSRICRISIALGDFEAAHIGLNDSLALERQSGSRLGMAYALNFLGELALAEDDPERAREPLEESLTIIRKAEDEWALGRGLANLSRLAYMEGDMQAARDLAEEGLLYASRVGDTVFIHSATLALGRAHLAQGDLDLAKAHLLSSLAQARQRSSPPLMLDSLLEIGRLLDRIGQAERAAAVFYIVCNHTASSYRTRHTAGKLLGERRKADEYDVGALERLSGELLETGIET